MWESCHFDGIVWFAAIARALNLVCIRNTGFLNSETHRNTARNVLKNTPLHYTVYISSNWLPHFYTVKITGKQYFHLNPPAKLLSLAHFPKTDTIANLVYGLQSPFYDFTRCRVFWNKSPQWHGPVGTLCNLWSFPITPLWSRHVGLGSSDFCFLSAA